LLVFTVAANEAEEDIVCDRAEGGERVEKAGAQEEDGEGEVDEGVAKIAVFVSFVAF
jgi:hypothetical protein